MTLAEVQAAWLRWMHRADLSEDIGTVTALAQAKVAGRTMYNVEGVTVEDSVADNPKAWLHAGLCVLHELSQDDEGLVREEQLFETAMRDHHFRRSIGTVDAVMTQEQ